MQKPDIRFPVLLIHKWSQPLAGTPVRHRLEQRDCRLRGGLHAVNFVRSETVVVDGLVGEPTPDAITHIVVSQPVLTPDPERRSSLGEPFLK